MKKEENVKVEETMDENEKVVADAVIGEDGEEITVNESKIQKLRKLVSDNRTGITVAGIVVAVGVITGLALRRKLTGSDISNAISDNLSDAVELTTDAISEDISDVIE